MYIFNWLEFCQRSNNQFEGILVLSHALVIGYNKLIAVNSEQLRRILHIDNIPNVLFERNALTTDRYGRMFSKYKTDDPQSYFRNSEWIYDKVPVYQRVGYLFLLSQRSIANKNNFIPANYVEQNIWNNIYAKKDGDKLWLTPEKTFDFKSHRR